MITKLDAINIQECLYSYAMLLERTEPKDSFEEAMKDDRIKIVHYLMDKCEGVLKHE